MTHVVSKPSAPFLSRSGSLRVHQIPAWQDNLIWLLECTQTGDTAIVDGPEATPVLEYIQRHSLELHAIFNTHTHGDHIGVNRALDKIGMLQRLRVVGSSSAPSVIPGLTEAVGDGDVITLGACEGRVMLTEGHLDGHVSFLMDGVLFCGDTLFAGGCGYLFDGPPEKMHGSLSRFAELEDDTLVCCAHEYTQDNLRFAYSIEPGNQDLMERGKEVWERRGRGECVVPSTIGLERRTNPFMRTGSPELIANLERLVPESKLETEAQVFAATRKLKDLKYYKDLGVPDAWL